MTEALGRLATPKEGAVVNSISATDRRIDTVLLNAHIQAITAFVVIILATADSYHVINSSRLSENGDLNRLILSMEGGAVLVALSFLYESLRTYHRVDHLLTDGKNKSLTRVHPPDNV